MSVKVLIAHDEDEEAKAEELAVPIREAGYDVFHRGTVNVGESVPSEFSKLLGAGMPVVLCGTVQAIGSGWARRLALAARGYGYAGTRLFIVQMERKADVDSVAFDGEKIALYWQNPAKAMQELLDALRQHFPLSDKETAAGEIPSQRSAIYPTETEAYLKFLLRDAKELEEKYIDLSATTVKADVPASSKSFTLEGSLIPPSFRVLDKSHGSTPQTETILDSISEALELHQYFVLLGDPGSGKSTTLKKLLVDQAKKAMGDPQAKIPVLINLARWPSEISDFSSLLVHEFTLQGVRSVHVDHTLIMLDGLNEIAAQFYSARVKALDEWLKAKPKATVIISCREKHYLNSKKLAIPSVHILPFDVNRIQLFLNAYLGSDTAEKLLPQLGSLNQPEPRDLIHLAHNPYLLRLICFLYQENNQKIPNSRGELFHKFVEVLYAREQDYNLTFGISHKQMLDAFSGIAFAMQSKRLSTSVHTAWAAKHIINNVDMESLWTLGRGASLLEFAKDGRVLQFKHQLILEYFAAEGLLKRSDDLKRYIEQPKFLDTKRKSGVWDEVLFTLAGLIDSDDFLLKLAEIDSFVVVDCFEHTQRSFVASDKLIQYIVVRFISYFSSHSSDAKLAAIAKLEQLGEDVVFEYLLEALQKTDNIITKREGLKILSKYKNPRALVHIILSLNDKDKWARKDSEKLLAENFKQSDIETAYCDFLYPLLFQSNIDVFANLTTRLYCNSLLSLMCILLINDNTTLLMPLLLRKNDFVLNLSIDLRNLLINYTSSDADRIKYILSVIKKIIDNSENLPEYIKLKCLFPLLTFGASF